ncbi:MAG: carbohydrate ABC transporter permease [Clostridiales bacterium]|nr:carbohydrate ABC transporter permease [Clostridiales bacterium]
MAENEVVVRKALKSKNRNLNPFILLLFTILVIYVVVFTYMLVWAFYNSFKPAAQWGERQFMQLPVYTNEMWSVDGFFQGIDANGSNVTNRDIYFKGIFYNYTKVVAAMPGKARAEYYAGWNLDVKMPKQAYNNTFFMIIFNTLVYSIVGSVIIGVVPCVVGYVAAKYPYKFSTLLYVITLFVMIMPLVGTEPARIKLLCRLYLFDTMWGDWIVNFTFANMYFLVFLAFYQGVSGTYAEAAEVDGASQLRTMVQIIMPLASKMIMTIALIFFIGRWNNYTTPLIYMPNIWMISYRLYTITTLNANTLGDDPTKIAAAMIIVVPIVIVFIFLKDKIMGNISMGGLKE